MSHPLVQLIITRLREFYREPAALFWVYAFPILLALALGLAFSSRAPDPARVDVQEVPGSDAAQLVEYLNNHGILAELHTEADCRQRLRTGRTALFIVPAGDSVDEVLSAAAGGTAPAAGGRGQGEYTFVYDSFRPESVLAQHEVDALLLRRRTGTDWQPKLEQVTEKGSRYLDFLMPGLIGLNLMGGGLWGLGYVIVDLRVRKLLKRLLATPMRRSHFLLALLISRMLLLLPEMLVLVLVSCLGFGVPLRGGVLTLALVIFVGAVAFSGIGLLIACRAEKSESVTGLMNLVALPMYLVSGVFFSSKRFPEVVQPIIQALPLTQVNDALREVMLEGASLGAVAWRLAILAAWGLVTFFLALKFFKWK
jgi:ABC-2 type transport system permease protein